MNTSHPSNRSAFAFPEALESRRLFAATVTVGGGFLNIEGDNSAEQLSVVFNVLTRQYSVATQTKGAQQSVVRYFPEWGISQVRIAGNGGDDLIICKVPVVSTLIGDQGNDNVMSLSSARSYLLGYGGNDSLTGGPGDDYLYGMDGNDTLDGAGGADVLHGMVGHDTVSYQYRTTPLILSISGLATSGANNERDSIMPDVEAIWGGHGNDLIYGSAQGNYLFGGAGHDTLKGFGGDDVLQGNDGNDFIDGGAGNDFCIGDFGDDVFEGRDGGTGDSFIGGAGRDTAFIDFAGSARDYVREVELF